MGFGRRFRSVRFPYIIRSRDFQSRIPAHEARKRSDLSRRHPLLSKREMKESWAKLIGTAIHGEESLIVVKLRVATLAQIREDPRNFKIVPTGFRV